MGVTYHHLEGRDSERPAPDVAGNRAIWHSNDTGAVYRSTGAAWITETPGSDTLTETAANSAYVHVNDEALYLTDSRVGGVMDGATDIGPAFNTALGMLPASGVGAIVVPPGVGLVATTIVLPTTQYGYSIRGQGPRASTLKLAGAANKDLITYSGVIPSTNPRGMGGYGNPDNQDWISFTDLGFDGNKANQSATSRAMFFTSLDYLLIDRCGFWNWYSNAIRVDACDEGIISNSFFDANGSATSRPAIILGSATHDYMLSNLGIESSGGAAIAITGGYELSIVNCNTWANYRDVEVTKPGATTPRDISIIANQFEAATDSSIVLSSGSGFTVNSNRFLTPTLMAVSLAGVTDSQVVANLISNAASGIIESGVADRNVVALNKMLTVTTKTTKVGSSSVFLLNGNPATLATDATDLDTVIALANDIKAKLAAQGLA